MKILLFFLMTLSLMNARAQDTKYEISTDAKNGEKVFRGKITWNDLAQEPSFTWLNSASDYSPAARDVARIQYRITGVGIVFFIGTWCDDSHSLIPKLRKVLDAIGYPITDVVMYGVDREKTTGAGTEKQYDITLVPTLILVADGKELGRITETPQKTIEADMAEILEKNRNR